MFRQGARVIAVRNIGGVMRDFVPAGSVGVVSRVPMFGRNVDVVFQVRRWMVWRQVIVNVGPGEVEPY